MRLRIIAATLAVALIVLDARGGGIDNWKLLSPYPTPHDFYAVEYGNGVFLGLSDRGMVFISHEGIDWLETVPIRDISFKSLAFGNGIFVAADGSGLLSSDLGQMWTPRFADATRPISRTKFMEGHFYAWGAHGVLLASADGMNWFESAKLPDSAAITDIALGGGSLMAVGMQVPYEAEQTQTAIAWTSSDLGQTWKTNLMPGGFQPSAITYGSGRFVAVGFRSIFSSIDGATWVQVGAALPPNSLHEVRFLNGEFVTVGDVSAVATSTDGVGWMHTQALPPAALVTVAYGTNVFVAAGSLGEIFSSTDARTWVRRSRGTRDSLTGIAYADGNYLVTGQSLFIRSTNAEVWTELPTGLSDFGGIAHGNGRFVAVTHSGLATASVDGTSWTTNRMDSSGNVSPSFVSFNNGQFLAGAQGRIYSSQDGLNWLKSELQPHAAPGAPFESPQFIQGVAYGNGRFVAVGGNWLLAASPGVSYTSTDGLNWTLHVLNSDYLLTGVAYGNGIFVATRYDNSGSGQNIFTSRDGSEWQPQKLPIKYILLINVAFGNGWFVATDINGQIVVSPDAVSWTKIDQQSASYAFRRATFAEDRFTLVGDYGTVLQSDLIQLVSPPPRFTAVRSAPGSIKVDFSSPTPAILSVEGSRDFITWDRIVTVTNGPSPYTLSLPFTTNRLGYFRLRATAP